MEGDRTTSASEIKHSGGEPLGAVVTYLLQELLDPRHVSLALSSEDCRVLHGVNGAELRSIDHLVLPRGPFWPSQLQPQTGFGAR